MLAENSLLLYSSATVEPCPKGTLLCVKKHLRWCVLHNSGGTAVLKPSRVAKCAFLFCKILDYILRMCKKWNGPALTNYAKCT